MCNTNFENSTYHLISQVAYLIGVPRHVFDNEHEPPRMEVFNELEQNKNARVIRHLCMIRTAIERNFSDILTEFHFNMKNLHTAPELIPQDCLQALENDGINLVKANHKIQQYIVDINQQIVNRIYSCKSLFPVWLNWEYIKRLFIMPDGLSLQGTKNAAHIYYSNLSRYPYQVYINWHKEAGNILYNDKKFVSVLYAENNDQFRDFSKVTDAGVSIKDDIYQFLDDHDRTIIVVDCENSDPYKLYAVLKNLNCNMLLGRVKKIILCDDIHTTTAWGILNQFTSIPVEHEIITRIKAGKSLVDPKLVAKTCKEVYKNDVDSVILFSSDSDYWGLISEVDDADFLVMVESRKCGPDIKNALIHAGITYAYIDDFCTGNSYEIKVSAVLSEVRHRLDAALHINMKQMLDEIFTVTRADMTANEQKQFYDRYIKSMHLRIADNGDATLELG